MAKTKISGLGKSEGKVLTGFTPVDAGEYGVEVVSAEEATSRSGLLMYKVKLTIIDAPEQSDERDVNGGALYLNLAILDEEHEYRQLSIDKLKNFLLAADVLVKADAFNIEDSIGSEFYVTVAKTTQTMKDKDGKIVKDADGVAKTIEQNDIKDCYKEE